MTTRPGKATATNKNRNAARFKADRNGQALIRRALRALRRSDVRLATIINHVGPYRLVLTADPFRTLFGSIVQQQISMSAGATIQRRLRDLCPQRRVTAQAVLGIPNEKLRAAGLSRQKATYVTDLAQHFATRRLTAAGLRRMTDDEVIAAATQVKGIGRWTAEMLLIFCLGRLDVWPIDDLGLRKAVQRMCGHSAMPSTKEMQAVGEPLRPYRSIASWYLWRSLEGPLLPSVTPS